ncbi:MAG: M20/M25/M40 family metallo-hydrolase [Bryocella sp.]
MVNPQSTLLNLDELRALTGDNDGAQRVAWSPMWLKAREWFQAKLDELQRTVAPALEHHYDAAGNHWVTLPGASEKALVLGSHLDSVPNGGWLDGCLGVLAGLEVLTELAREYNGKPPITVKLVDWADEEGARFGRSLFGSSAFAGSPGCIRWD